MNGSACELCKKEAELRPLGPNDEKICRDCALEHIRASGRKVLEQIVAHAFELGATSPSNQSTPDLYDICMAAGVKNDEFVEMVGNAYAKINSAILEMHPEMAGVMQITDFKTHRLAIKSVKMGLDETPVYETGSLH